jgi:hypothetical protein
MKWRDMLRPRYLHSDICIRHEALSKIRDTEKLRQIYTKAGSEYRDVQFAVAFLLKDKKLIYDLITDSAYWLNTHLI